MLGSFKEKNVGYHLLVKNEGGDIRTRMDMKYPGGKANSFKIKNLYVNSPMKRMIETLQGYEIGYMVTSLKEPLRIGTVIGTSPRESS